MSLIRVCLVLCTGCFSASAATLFLPREGNHLDSVNPDTGSVAQVASLGFRPFTDGFAIDAAANMAYLSNRSRWASVDLLTGAVQSLPISGSVFDGSGGFGIDAGRIIIPRASNKLDAVDPGTGAVTTLANLPFAPFTDGFAVDSVHHVAYASNRSRWAAIDLYAGTVIGLPIPGSVFDGSGGFGTDSLGRIIIPRANNDLVAVTPLTGAVTTLAHLPFAPFTDGFAIDAVNDVAYLSNQSQWVSVDLNTGAVRSLPIAGSVFNSSGGFGVASAAVPEPACLLLVAPVLGALLVRRRGPRGEARVPGRALGPG